MIIIILMEKVEKKKFNIVSNVDNAATERRKKDCC